MNKDGIVQLAIYTIFSLVVPASVLQGSGARDVLMPVHVYMVAVILPLGLAGVLMAGREQTAPKPAHQVGKSRAPY